MLVYLKSSKTTCIYGHEPLESDGLQVKMLLRQEAAGLSACGDCEMCKTGGRCKRALNRDALRTGRRGAQWAEEAERLVGRVFDINRSGEVARGVVREYNRRTTMHKVEWKDGQPSSRKRKVREADERIEKEFQWVDFALDTVLGEVE